MTPAQRLAALEEVERNCPCGARPESPQTHPHVSGCPLAAVLASLRADGEAPAHAPMRAALVEARNHLHGIYGTASSGSSVLDLYDRIDAALSAAPPAPTPPTNEVDGLKSALRCVIQEFATHARWEAANTPPMVRLARAILGEVASMDAAAIGDASPPAPTPSIEDLPWGDPGMTDAAPAPTGAPENVMDGPRCPKHRVLKLARAHYYCEECAAEESRDAPYFVERNDAKGETLVVIGPDGEIGIIFDDEHESDAEDLAELLNTAYSHGQANPEPVAALPPVEADTMPTIEVGDVLRFAGGNMRILSGTRLPPDPQASFLLDEVLSIERALWRRPSPQEPT